MNHENMFPVCTILYKTDNSDGWYYAIMSGSEKECKKECEKRKKEQNWYDYKCYVSSNWVYDPKIPFGNYTPNAYDLHLCTDLIYNPYNNKIYNPDEVMPYPNNKVLKTENFEIIVKGEGEDDENIWESDDIDDFECGTDVTISFNNENDKIITVAEDIVKDIPIFIKRLQKTGYANLSIEEYTYTKFLAWEIQDKVRFIVHYYGDNNIKTEFDKLMSKELFYNEFKKFGLKLKKYIDRHNKLFEEFKLQEEYLQSLKWEFDTTTIEKPKEYIFIDCINNKNSVFELFRKNIKEKSEEHTVNFDTNEKSYCYKANDYYYWCDENRIIRKFFYTYKEKDTIRFLKSKDFEYKQGMSLTEIYAQLLDKGYHQAIDCKYKNKKVLIYANGQVESAEATKEEKEELERIIKQLANNIKDKKNLTVSKFVELLKPNIDCSSFRDNQMKL